MQSNYKSKFKSYKLVIGDLNCFLTFPEQCTSVEVQVQQNHNHRIICQCDRSKVVFHQTDHTQVMVWRKLTLPDICSVSLVDLYKCWYAVCVLSLVHLVYKL